MRGGDGGAPSPVRTRSDAPGSLSADGQQAPNLGSDTRISGRNTSLLVRARAASQVSVCMVFSKARVWITWMGPDLGPDLHVTVP